MRKSTSMAVLLAPILALSASPALAAGTTDKTDRAADAESFTKQHELVMEARATAQRFADDPGIEWVKRNVGRVKGVFIVPEQVRGAFMIGASGGSGVMLSRQSGNTWSYPAFYTMGSLSFGFQAGGKVSELVLLVMTDNGLDAFKDTSVKLGADVSVAAGPIGTGAKAETADILAFSRGKGLYGGVSLEGAVITARDEWNTAYYGKRVSPAQILFDRGTANADANPLRQAVAQLFNDASDATGSLQRKPSMEH